MPGTPSHERGCSPCARARSACSGDCPTRVRCRPRVPTRLRELGPPPQSLWNACDFHHSVFSYSFHLSVFGARSASLPGCGGAPLCFQWLLLLTITTIKQLTHNNYFS